MQPVLKARVPGHVISLRLTRGRRLTEVVRRLAARQEPSGWPQTVACVLGHDLLLEGLRELPGVGLSFISSGGAVYDAAVTGEPGEAEERDGLSA